jgi:hypothetical protein
MGTRPFFSNLPYWAGATDKLAVMLSGAALAYKRFLILGDSQETDGASGVNYIPSLNYQAFARFGAPSELPFVSGQSTALFFLQGTNAANCVLIPSTLGVTNPIPQNQVWLEHTSTIYGPLIGLSPNGVNHPVTDTGETIYRCTGDTVFDAFLQTNTSGPTDVRVVEGKGTGKTYSPTFIANHTSSGLNLNASTGTFVKYTTGALAPWDPALPYINLRMHGRAGGVDASGLRYMGGRFRQLNRNRGLTFTSISTGGAGTWHIFNQYGASGAAIRYQGPWDCVFIHLGPAETSRGDATAFRANMQQFITDIKSANWLDNPNQLIVLVSDPPVRRSFYPLINYTNYQQFAAAALELARTNDNVCFMNLPRRMIEAGGEDYTIDGVHMDANQSVYEAHCFWWLLDNIRKA